MKKRVIWSAGILLCICLCLFAFGESEVDVITTVGSDESEIYSSQDIEQALDVIDDKFRQWPGFEMHTIRYLGDEFSKENLSYCSELKEEADFIQCIVFESSFTSGREDWSGFTGNQVYSGWKWFLAREEGGKWELITYGYG